MTLTDRTASARTERLEFELDRPHPPERVWRALTGPALLAEWLLPSIGFRLERGAAFRFETEPVGGWDGVVQCRIADLDPPRRLACDRGVGDVATVVTFTFEPAPPGTRLSLVQSGFRADQKRNLGGARYGWRTMGERLVDLLGRIP